MTWGTWLFGPGLSVQFDEEKNAVRLWATEAVKERLTSKETWKPGNGADGEWEGQVEGNGASIDDEISGTRFDGPGLSVRFDEEKNIVQLWATEAVKEHFESEEMKDWKKKDGTDEWICQFQQGTGGSIVHDAVNAGEC